MVREKDNYTTKTDADIERLLTEKQKKLLDEKMNFAQRKTKDVHVLKKIRKDIARLKTTIQLRKGVS